MIYNLNGETHWELSIELMRKLIRMSDKELEHRHESMLNYLGIELSNFRSALECELLRLREQPIDNTDLTS